MKIVDQEQDFIQDEINDHFWNRFDDGFWWDLSVSEHTIKSVWPNIAKDLGLVDDGTGTDTYTIPGKELKILPALREYAKKKGYV